MEDIPSIALFFVAVFALFSVPISIAVGLRRAKTGISLLHGEDDDLLRRIRAHGNFVEYVPLALLTLAAAEIAGIPAWIIWSSGWLLVAARLVHYVALRKAPEGPGRLAGAFFTNLVLLGLGIAIIVQWAGR